jgi:hypothetical protein
MTAMVIITYAKWHQFIKNRRRDHILLMVLISACAKMPQLKKVQQKDHKGVIIIIAYSHIS